MKFLKNPISKIGILDTIVTLPFGDKTYAEAYKKLGWNIDRHNGIDLVPSGIDQECYGSPVYAAHDGVIQKVVWEGSTSTKGNGITIEGIPFIDNSVKMLVCTIYWHLSDVLVKAGDFVRAGQIIGLMGNSGFTTGTGPFGGTHLHFMVYPYLIDGGDWKPLLENTVQGADDPVNWFEDNWNKNGQPYQANKSVHMATILGIVSKTLKWLLTKVEDSRIKKL